MYLYANYTIVYQKYIFIRAPIGEKTPRGTLSTDGYQVVSLIRGDIEHMHKKKSSQKYY